MYSENVNQHLDRIIVMKQNTLEALPLYQSTVTYASVVKGAKASNKNIDDDNVSNMTEQSIEKNENEENPEKKRKEQSKENQSTVNSVDNQSSVWSKESVVNKINILTEELKKERSEREQEKRERLK